jgi:hypothetical protein
MSSTSSPSLGKSGRRRRERGKQLCKETSVDDRAEIVPASRHDLEARLSPTFSRYMRI